MAYRKFHDEDSTAGSGIWNNALLDAFGPVSANLAVGDRIEPQYAEAEADTRESAHHGGWSGNVYKYHFITNE